MNPSLLQTLESITTSVAAFGPELVLTGGVLLMILLGLIFRTRENVFHFLTITLFSLTIVLLLSARTETSDLFSGMLRVQGTTWFRILISLGGLLTVLMTTISRVKQVRLPEYYALVLTVCLGANLLVMSENLVILFLAIELVSIGSYILTSFSFDKRSAEGSLKYFIFGSIASAVMLYGLTLLYGISGSVFFTSAEFAKIFSAGPLGIIALTFTIGGFLYKIAAAPMHPWAPDVYESSPVAVVAFFSVVPKLAGLAILSKFIYSFTPGTGIDWQTVIAGIAILTLTIGNFSALWQKNVKRLMAYSSIAQSGFMLVAVSSYHSTGNQFLLFYATIYLVLTFLVFFYLQYFENIGLSTIADFSGIGKTYILPSVLLGIGFVGLIGLPPTAGFTAKLFVFSGLWDAYAVSGKPILLWLFIFGLLNTVVSLFFYLRIPFYSFIRPSATSFPANNLTWENLLGLISVLLVLLFFFSPELLMRWINKINFAF